MKLLKGNPGRRPLRNDEPRPAPGEPEKPRTLAGCAAEHWDELAALLRGEGRLNRSVGPLLVQTCRAYARAVRLQQAVENLSELTFLKVSVDGAGVEHHEPKAHPLLQQVRLAEAHYRHFLNDLCLSPGTIARAKVTTPPVDSVAAQRRRFFGA